MAPILATAGVKKIINRKQLNGKQTDRESKYRGHSINVPL